MSRHVLSIVCCCCTQSVRNQRIQIGEESLGANHVSRCGWSVDVGNYQLGEYPKSWGYGGTAKLVNDSKFTDYNMKYYNGDVITCYLVRNTRCLRAYPHCFGVKVFGLHFPGGLVRKHSQSD